MARGLKKIVRSDDSEFAGSDVVHLNPVESLPRTVGELLQTKREEFGVELREAAGYLNIRYNYLLAIEEGRVDDLPGAAYAMGFVRAYADYLGLNGPAIVERYKDETAELGDDIRLVFPSPLPEGKVPSGTIILVAVISLVLVYAGWAIFAQQNVKFAELVPALPEQFSSLLGSGDAGDVSKTVTGPPTETAAVATKPSAVEAQPPTLPVSPAPAPEAPRMETVAAAGVIAKPVADQPNDRVAATPTVAPPEPASVQTEAAPVVDKPVVVAVHSGRNTVVRSETVAASDAAENVNESRAATPVPAAESSALPNEPNTSISAPAELTSVADSPTAEEMRQVTEPQTTPVVPVDQVDTTTTPAGVAPAETQQVAAIAPLPPEPPAVASAEPRQYGSDDGVSRVTIKARIDSWVQISDPDGTKLLTRVLRAGDSFRVPDKPDLLMETGNAGGLEITVDGSVIPDIGPNGAVRRNVALDADSLKAGTSR